MATPIFEIAQGERDGILAWPAHNGTLVGEAGYCLHLANTIAMRQYDGIKYTDDNSDARYLAHLLRLGILPEGYLYPKEQRTVRDLCASGCTWSSNE